jgi:hypothetical protein
MQNLPFRVKSRKCKTLLDVHKQGGNRIIIIEVVVAVLLEVSIGKRERGGSEGEKRRSKERKRGVTKELKDRRREMRGTL